MKSIFRQKCKKCGLEVRLEMEEYNRKKFDDELIAAGWVKKWYGWVCFLHKKG